MSKLGLIGLSITECNPWGHTKKCANEQYHRMLGKACFQNFKNFIPATVYVYLSAHVYAHCVLLPVCLNNEI